MVRSFQLITFEYNRITYYFQVKYSAYSQALCLHPLSKPSPPSPRPSPCPSRPHSLHPPTVSSGQVPPCDIQTQKLMFDLQASSSQQRRQERREGQSSRYMQSQRFIPPSHPVYLVTPSFEAPHILRLQEECDRLCIALAMQTSKKKLMRVPEFPQDRFFIITDDSLAPLLLEGEFLTITSQVVGYPRAHSLQQVVESFKEYIGLGHYETTEQYYQNNEHVQALQENRQTTVLVRNAVGTDNTNIHTGLSSLVANLDRKDAVNSAISTFNASKIELREVSSLKAESKISRGRLYVYDNRKDNSEFKSLVVELKSRFSSVSCIRFIERIDEYNNEGRITRENDNVVLISHYSFLNLSKYFLKYRSFALFLTADEKIDLFMHKHVAVATARREKLFAFVEMFLQGRSQIAEAQEERPKGTQEVQRGNAKKIEKEPLVGSAKVKDTVQHVPLAIQNKGQDDNRAAIEKEKSKGKQIYLKNVSPTSQAGKAQIQLIRVTDLPKDAVQRLRSHPKPSVLQEEKKKVDSVPPLTTVNSHPSLQIQQPNNQTVVPISIKPGQKVVNKIPLQPTIPMKYTSNYIPEVKTKEAAGFTPERGPLSHLIMAATPNDISFQDRSEHTKKSKIKRLKSTKKLAYELQPQIQAEEGGPFGKELNELQPQASLTRRSPQNPLTSHLRMGSDDNNSRSKSRPRPGHARAHSDSEQFPMKAPEIKISVPIPAEESEPNDYYSLLPEEKCQLRQPKERKMPQSREVSIGILSSVKEKQSQKQLSVSVLVGQQNMEENIIHSIRRPKSKNNMTQKIDKVPEGDEEEGMLRKPKAHFTVKHTGGSFREQEQVKIEEQADYLGIFMHPVPKDELQLQRLKNRMKVNADEYNITATPKHHRKVLKASAVPPSFQTVTASQIEPSPITEAKGSNRPQEHLSANEISNLDGDGDDDFETPAISNISSIPPKNGEGGGKGKRFTFGVEEPPQDYYGLSRGANKPRQGLKTPIGKISNLAASQNPSGLPYGLEASPQLPNESSQFRPNKSKSMQQVHRVFNRYKSKPVEQFANGAQIKGDPQDPQDSRRSSGSGLSRLPSTLRPGKIYSNLKCKAEKSRVDGITPSKLSSHSASHPSFKGQEHQIAPSGVAPSYEHYRNKGIEDLIDLNRYDRVVENGVVVYRSKFPVQVTHYTPTQLTLSPHPSIFGLKPGSRAAAIPPRIALEPEGKRNPQQVTVSALITPQIVDYPQEDPYGALPHSKQNRRPAEKADTVLKRSKSGVTPLVRYCPKGTEREQPKDSLGCNHKKTPPNTYSPLTESVVSQAQSNPFHPYFSPNKPSNRSKLHQKSLSPKPATSHVSLSGTQQRHKQSVTPIQDMLASKLSSSNEAPLLIHDMHPPTGRDYFDDHSSDSSRRSSSHEQAERMVLYLIDKRQSSSLFEQLGGVRSRKDSLLTFKSEKQLAQQLPQTIHVYDLVYVIPMHPSKAIEALTKEYQNVFTVEVAEGRTKIKGNRVSLSSLKYLGDVSELLLKQVRPQRRVIRNKGRTYVSPGKIEEKGYFLSNNKHFRSNCCHQQPCHCSHASLLSCRQ